MRIALVYNWFLMGGCEVRMATLARNLLRRGDDCWVVAARTRGDQARRVCRMANLPREHLLLLGGFRFAERLHRWLCEVRPDVIDYQYPSGLEQFPVPEGSRAVVTVHGWEQLPAQGQVSDYMISVCRLPPDSPARVNRQCFEIWNGVDLERFHFHDDPGEGIAFFGRVEMRKMRALMRVWDRLEQLDLYGPLERRTRRAFRSQHPPRCAHLYKQADPVQVMPSYKVIFCSGLVALEAMAQGRLVVVGHDEAIVPRPEIMQELSAAKFAAVPPGQGLSEPGRILEEVSWLLSNSHLGLRRFYRDYVAQYHDATKQAEQVRRVYEEAVASP